MWAKAPVCDSSEREEETARVREGREGENLSEGLERVYCVTAKWFSAPWTGPPLPCGRAAE